MLRGQWSSEEGVSRGVKPLLPVAEDAEADASAYPEARAGRMWMRWMQALAVSVLAVVMLGAADPSDPSARFGRLGHQMICQCGCAQVLLDCNHVGCPVSPVMISELNTRLDAGGTDTSIFNWFIAKYGAPVLAAPIRGGFDNVAWIAPVAVFLMATVGTAVLIRVWKLRGVAGRPAAAAGGGDLDHGLGIDAMRERIRRETEY